MRKEGVDRPPLRDSEGDEHSEHEGDRTDCERDREAVVGREAAGADAAGEDRGDGGTAEGAADGSGHGIDSCRDSGLRGPDVLDDQVGHRRERQADPGAEQQRGSVDLPALAAGEGQEDMAQAVSAAPASSGGFDPYRFSSRPVCAPAISIASVVASIRASEDAIAEITVPAQRSTSTTTSRRSLPYMSPRRPISGVAIDALNRYAVNTQLTPVTEVCRSRWMSGSAGATSDCSSA